jgi:hypothetical protein
MLAGEVRDVVVVSGIRRLALVSDYECQLDAEGASQPRVLGEVVARSGWGSERAAGVAIRDEVDMSAVVTGRRAPVPRLPSRRR